MAKLVSKVYGDALFEAAREAGRMDDMYEEVLELQKLLQANEELQKMMENPKVIREDKANVIETVFRGRISDYFIGLVKEEKKIGIAYVTTAVELTDGQKDEIVRRLLETTRYESFEMNYAVDASLIGGMVIRIGDRVVDSSIKTKLYELSKSLRKIQV